MPRANKASVALLGAWLETRNHAWRFTVSGISNCHACQPGGKAAVSDAAAEARQLGVEMRSRGQSARLVQLLGGGLVISAATLLTVDPDGSKASAQAPPGVEKFVVDDRG